MAGGCREHHPMPDGRAEAQTSLPVTDPERHLGLRVSAMSPWVGSEVGFAEIPDIGGAVGIRANFIILHRRLVL
jgi:hypothetical protein